MEALEDSLAEENEDPGVQDGVEGVESEGEQVPHLAAVGGDGLGEATNLRTQSRGKEGKDSPFHPASNPSSPGLQQPQTVWMDSERQTDMKIDEERKRKQPASRSD